MSETRMAAAEEPQEISCQMKPVILIAEDNEVNLKVFELYLADFDCELLVAKNGKQAVAHFRDNDVDLILMDIMMPVMDGLEATRRIRSLERKAGRKQTPIIAVTAHIKPADQHICINSGTNDYLSKPVSKGDLTSSMKIWAPHLCEDTSMRRASA